MKQSPPSVVFVVGARPNFMKAAPVIAALRDAPGRFDHMLVHTGQHYDDEMSEVFFDELGLPTPTSISASAPAPHAVQTAHVMVGWSRY